MKLTLALALLLLGGCVDSTPQPEPQPAAIAAAAKRYIQEIAISDTTGSPCTLLNAAITAAQYGVVFAPDSTDIDQWSWEKSSPSGAYYVARIQFAVSNNAKTEGMVDDIGPYWMEVKAVNVDGVSGPWSLVGWSSDGEALEGVAK